MAERRMSEFTRSTKRRFSRVTTTPRTLNAGMNQEFVDSRRRLHDVGLAVKRLQKTIESARQTWATVAREQRGFSSNLASSFPAKGDVHAHAVEVEKHLRDIQEKLLHKDGSEAPHQQILSVLGRYLDLLRSIEKEYGDVEVAYTEKMRYQTKVDKLQKKDLTHRKNSDKLVRNVEKFDEAQAKFDTKLEKILERMRNALQKHEAVLQCAHHAFWMANDTHLKTIDQATNDIRVETVAVHKLLLGLDIKEEEELEPVARMNLIAPAAERTEQITYEEGRTADMNNSSPANSEPVNMENAPIALTSGKDAGSAFEDEGRSSTSGEISEDDVKKEAQQPRVRFPSAIPAVSPATRTNESQLLAA